MAREFSPAAIWALALLVFTGCIEREETITIAADGSVSVHHVIRGDVHDLKGGAASLPSSGFTVKTYALEDEDRRWEAFGRLKALKDPRIDRMLPKLAAALKKGSEGMEIVKAILAKLKMMDDPAVTSLVGKLWEAIVKAGGGSGPRYCLEATARYGTVAEMPTSFAAPGDPGAARALRWQDRVEARTEGGRKARLFTRTYEGRRWGRYAYGESRWIAEHVPSLRKWASLSESRKLAVTRDLLRYERFKHEEFLAAAVREIAPKHPRLVDAVLAARAALAAEALSPESVLGVLRLPEGKSKTRIAALLAELERAALGGAARVLEFETDAKTRLARAYRSARHDFEVTDDLSDETFVIRLKLPGEVLRHNGDEKKGRTVTWRFSGRDLRDRDHRLAALWVIE